MNPWQEDFEDLADEGPEGCDLGEDIEQQWQAEASASAEPPVDFWDDPAAGCDLRRARQGPFPSISHCQGRWRALPSQEESSC
jgi:hypothetical protein